ncbi:hypothetical protein Psta_0589 [Pirellula staleyi DSM 6068]|uniref:Uncharacterized protein n=1 Tax=Pirellula staleyi (strain ATCC 27377 / DSM 6068 / ICPB 4128) TaxID=530564 RepID=D2R4C8_PIRSD|nr:hypothetical protein [Pirellula staleyi]ADB15276.1 hypothetical protein Psta_0589 [Pirellula staleyi DSM 6068]
MSPGKEYYVKQLATVKEKRSQLGSDSPISNALTDELLDGIANFINATPLHEISYSRWPLTYSYCCALSINQLREFNDDICLVLSKCKSKSDRKRLVGFLSHRADKDEDKDNTLGVWFGEHFDIWTKANAIRSGLGVVFDEKLPSSKKNNDISVIINDRKIRLESTVISEAKDIRQAWNTFREQRKRSSVPSTQGLTVEELRKLQGPSLYTSVVRIYRKVFDKLARKFNPIKSQLSESSPNILLLSCTKTSRIANSKAVDWALNELFRIYPDLSSMCSELPDWSVNFPKWLKTEVFQDQEVDEANWSRYEALRDAIRKISGVLVFNGNELCHSRINYNALPKCLVSHEEMLRTERIFTNCSDYLP